MKRARMAFRSVARKTKVLFVGEAGGWAGDLAGVLEEEGGGEWVPQGTAEDGRQGQSLLNITEKFKNEKKICRSDQ
jgi:hypothetical protein